MKHLILIFFFTLAFNFSYAQPSQEQQKAQQLCLQGIAEMDKGEIEKAILLFEQAKALDPDNFYYPYEIAHGHYLTKQYKKGIQILEPLLAHKDVTDHVFHLLGSCYEHSKNIPNALSTYLAGLEKFPNSGLLNYSLGNSYLKTKNYKEALAYFEQGIAADPDFSLNYYWASKVHASLEDKLWGIMYAELYINMEGVTPQSKELGKMIFDVYKQGIKISPAGVTIDLMDADTTHKNFEADFEKVFTQSASFAKVINIGTIAEIRDAFINTWKASGEKDKYPNLLFDWHDSLFVKGYSDPYHYWLLKEGNPEEYQVWVSKNKALYDEFIAWLSDHFLVPTPSNYFVTSKLIEQ